MVSVDDTLKDVVRLLRSSAQSDRRGGPRLCTAGGIRGPPRPRGRGWALVGKSRPEPREERVSALTGHDPLSIVLKRFHEPPAAIVADDAGRRVRPSPDVTSRTTTTAKQPAAVESCARRMMCSLWACVLIAPFAVSQCLGVPDPSGGVGVKAELPASGQCFLFDWKTPQQEYRA